MVCSTEKKRWAQKDVNLLATMNMRIKPKWTNSKYRRKTGNASIQNYCTEWASVFGKQTIKSVRASKSTSLRYIAWSHNCCAILQRNILQATSIFFSCSQRSESNEQYRNIWILPFNSFPDFYFFTVWTVCIWVNWIDNKNTFSFRNIACVLDRVVSSLTWTENSFRNLFDDEVPLNDYQFKFSLKNTHMKNSMFNYEYMRCSCHREKIQLCIFAMEQKQLKTKRTCSL